MIWLPAALLAGLFQAWRTALQQHLRSSLRVSGAGFVRYAWGLPFALAMASVWLALHGSPIPHLSGKYLSLAACGGVAQLFGTALLITGFGHRGFLVGTAFSKTEALQAAIAAAAFVGERLSPLSWLGIGAGLAGVLLLALMGRGLAARDVLGAMVQPAALCGLGAAALFATTGLLVKHASGELGGIDAIGAALLTLVVVMAIQTGIHGTWIAFKEPATFNSVGKTWRVSGQVGLLSACGSACWFTGFATAPVALVRIVGQIEVVFTVLFAHHLLKERPRAHELVGLGLVTLGVLLALAGQW